MVKTILPDKNEDFFALILSGLRGYFFQNRYFR